MKVRPQPLHKYRCLLHPPVLNVLVAPARLVCRLPVKSPWLNPIEPRWLHGKRAIVEPERTLTTHELMDRVVAPGVV